MRLSKKYSEKLARNILSLLKSGLARISHKTCGIKPSNLLPEFRPKADPNYKRLAVGAMKILFSFYKVGLRPHFGNACQFHPTCSCYAYEAFQRHNIFKATYLSIFRLLRCHPFSKGGFDPVPELKQRSDPNG